ncbi:DUF1295 domain-containing protein [Patescibacteria group bacterium]
MSVFLSVAVFTLLYMTLWFLISLLLKRNDIADIAWGLGFIFICGYLNFLGYRSNHFYLVAILTTLWGIRLAAHIFLRMRSKKEDFRYKKWREEWGKSVLLRSYFQVFILQGTFMYLISFSAIISALNTSSNLTPLSFLGVIIWCIGFYFEAVGDLQLKRFISKSSNKGRIMTEGLWRYTRHPNYFGEVVQWWGIFFTVVCLPLGIVALVSPLTISFLILKVSGIPMLEKKYGGKQEFNKYKENTNAFFPWFPRNVT